MEDAWPRLGQPESLRSWDGGVKSVFACGHSGLWGCVPEAAPPQDSKRATPCPPGGPPDLRGDPQGYFWSCLSQGDASWNSGPERKKYPAVQELELVIF